MAFKCTFFKNLFLMFILTNKAENITKYQNIDTTSTSSNSSLEQILVAKRFNVNSNKSNTSSNNLFNKTSKKTIKFGALLPFYTNHDQYNYASALIVAANLINENQNILANYNIQVEALETAGITGFALVKLFDLLERESKVAVIGPTNTKQVMITSKLCSERNILQISFSANDPMLGDKHQFPTLFRSNPDRISINLAQISLFKYNGWKRTAILYDLEDQVIFQTSQELYQLMINNSINVTFESFASSYLSPPYNIIREKIELFKVLDIRIIMLGVKAASLKYIFCQAYSQNMTGPKYQWIVLFEDVFSDWYSSKNLGNINCTSEQLIIASKGFIYLKFQPLRKDGVNTIANKTADQIWQLVKEQVNSLYHVPPKSIIYNELSMYAYDGLWALAILLDTAEKELDNFSIDLLLRRNASHVMKLAYLMEKIKFQGVSGQYSYLGNNSRDRFGDILYIQFSPNGTYNEIGYFSSNLRKAYLNTTKQKLIMPGFLFPMDGPVIIEMAIVYSLPMLITIWIFIAAGIILSLFFLFANIKHRSVGLIKLSSPNINSVISLGCILSYLSIVLYGMDSRIIKVEWIPYACDAIIVTLSTGFTLSFGGLFSKTWRIYKIFIKPRSLSSRGIRDLHLFGILFVLLLIDLVVFTVWMTTSPFTLDRFDMEPIINSAEDIVIVPKVYRCKCNYQYHFFVAIYVYKGFLLIFGLFMAWETRKIKIAVINDSKNIGMAVYNVAVLSVIANVGTAAIQQTYYFQIGYLLFSVCVIVCNTLTLLLVFAPKIRILLHGCEDPHFKNGRPSVTPQNSVKGSHPSTPKTSLKLYITKWTNPLKIVNDNNVSIQLPSLTNTYGSYSNTTYED
ncbi:gamma-aminobutyric acid type B receptor subunit 2 isoform X3 [Hydra vulgaris]|uniref:Gamma-aminobutyric acid type B receptor subunit 2 isoform X3 n=2 Tax=Hydra vulgaris TaxID=6087 RepID=A0ABM4BY71_HYDVU